MPSRIIKLPDRRIVAVFLLASFGLFAGAVSQASGQVSRRGNVVTFAVPQHVAASPVKGTDTAYDPANRVYLLVGGNYGGLGPAGGGSVWGRFVNELGEPVTGIFSIAPSGQANFPRARYSADVNSGQGGFLVTWLEEGGSYQNPVKARIVAYPGVVIGSEQQLSESTNPAWIESGAAIGYSPISKKFLVAWMTNHLGVVPFHLALRLVDVNAVPSGSSLRISSGLGRDPGVAWNSVTDRFGVSFGGEDSSGKSGFSVFAIVSPSGVLEARQTFNTIAGLTYITDTDYNPDTNRFVMTWWQGPAGVGPETRAAEIDSSGNVMASGLVTREFAGYNALSVAFNPVSRTFLAVSLPGTDVVVGAELNRNGVRTSPVTTLGPGVTARYTRVSASAHRPDWDITFSNAYMSAVNLVATTTTAGGGPPGTYSGGGSTSSSPLPSPSPGCPTVQPAPDWQCVNGNWQPPGMGGVSAPPPPPPPAPTPAPTPSSSTCSTVKPASDWVCVNGNWLPPGMVPSGSTSGGSTSGGSSSGSTSGASTSSAPCSTVRPAPDWVCVNGNWLPPGLAPAGSSTASCTTAKPASDWVCVSGNWQPPAMAGGCTGTDPFTAIPTLRGECVNGNWIPVIR
jgi:hypothetical protein